MNIIHKNGCSIQKQVDASFVNYDFLKESKLEILFRKSCWAPQNIKKTFSPKLIKTNKHNIYSNIFFHKLQEFLLLNSFENSKPIVSIILTHFNCTKFLPLAIYSIIRQTFKKIELIIIDDSSTDDLHLLNKIISICQKDSRIKFICQKKNVGCYTCKNIGISLSKGKYITFQDSDDFSHKKRIEWQYTNIMTNPKQVICNWCHYMSRILYPKMKLCEISLFINAAFFKKYIGYFDNVRVGGDSELRDRLSYLDIQSTTIPIYMYSCMDKWIDIPNRELSLTQGNDKELSIYGNIRPIYKAEYQKIHSQIKSYIKSSYIDGNYIIQYNFPNKEQKRSFFYSKTNFISHWITQENETEFNRVFSKLFS
jgi:glycosyltransferase involved in cell wall biosynthesis